MIRSGLVSLEVDLQEKADYRGGESSWRGSGSSHILGVPALGSDTGNSLASWALLGLTGRLYSAGLHSWFTAPTAGQRGIIRTAQVAAQLPTIAPACTPAWAEPMLQLHLLLCHSHTLDWGLWQLERAEVYMKSLFRPGQVSEHSMVGSIYWERISEETLISDSSQTITACILIYIKRLCELCLSCGRALQQYRVTGDWEGAWGYGGKD